MFAVTSTRENELKLAMEQFRKAFANVANKHGKDKFTASTMDADVRGFVDKVLKVFKLQR